MKNVFELEFEGKKFVVETGEIAKQADGAVLVRYNECVLVLTSRGNISDFMLYTLGLRDYSELDNLFTQYEQLLFETGYKKLTSDEIDEYGIFVWADSNDVANVYMINDTFAIEVYAFGYEGMFAGFNLFIYAI